MKKRKISRLSLRKEQISKLTAIDVRGGLGAGSQCPDTCSCECSNECTQTCNGEESECKPCYSEIQ